MRWCCTLMKSNPVNKMLQKFEKKVLNFDGIRKAESPTRNKYARIAYNTKIYKQITAHPIFVWPTLAVWLYIFKYRLPINPAYFNGFSRVGCGMCPSNSSYDSIILSEFYINNDKNEKEQQKFKARWKKFKEEIVQFASTNEKEDPEKYFEEDYWKSRKPIKKRKVAIKSYQTKHHLLLNFLHGIPEYLPEYLKPIASFQMFEDLKHFKSYTKNPILIEGTIGEKDLNVYFTQNNEVKIIKKQILKAINCIGCGNCVYICPIEAISLNNGKVKINQKKCIHCLKCITDVKCVALDYKATKFFIKDVE